MQKCGQANKLNPRKYWSDAHLADFRCILQVFSAEGRCALYAVSEETFRSSEWGRRNYSHQSAVSQFRWNRLLSCPCGVVQILANVHFAIRPTFVHQTDLHIIMKFSSVLLKCHLPICSVRDVILMLAAVCPFVLLPSSITDWKPAWSSSLSF